MENTQAPAEEKLITITQFVEQHQRTIAVIGVFIAIASFLLKLPLQSLSVYLAFVSLTVTLPLFYEIYKYLFNNKTTLSLKVFTNVLTIFVGYFIWYILVVFRDQWKVELEKVVFWIIVLPIYFGIYKRFFKGKVKIFVIEKIKKLLKTDDESYQKKLDLRVKEFRNNLVAEEKSKLQKKLELEKLSKDEILEKLEIWEKEYWEFANLSREEKLSQIQDTEIKIAWEKFYERGDKVLIAFEKTDNFLDNIFFFVISAALLLILGIFVSAFIAKPTADFINTGLDMVYESYQKNEQEHQKQNQITPDVPPVNSNSNQ